MPRLHARPAWLLVLLLLSAEAGAQVVLATVAAGSEPRAIAVNPKTGKAYVANEFSDDVTVVDGATHATTRVAVGRRPQSIAVNTATNKVFVGNAQDASISVIDGATLAVQAYPVNGSGPFLVDEAINRVYMARLGNADEVTYFDANANTWYTIATDSYSPVALSLNPYTKRLFVANAASGDIRVVDTTSPSDHPPSVSVGVWSKPVAVGVNPATNKAYVATLDARGPIAVVDGNSNAATFLAPPGHLAGATSLVVSPWTNKVYGGFANEVAVLDGATNALTFLPTGSVVALALDPTSNVVYALTAAGPVVAIDGATNATTTFPVPAGGKAIAVDPVANRVYVAGTSGVTVLQGLGAAGAPPPMPAAPAASFGANVQGMWWASPGGSESGWGIDIAHQGNMLFATWFTYDANGQPTWLAMSSGFRNGDNAYTGDLYRLTGPPMSGAFDPRLVAQAKVGAASLSFVDADNGNFTAQVDGVSVFRKITRFQYTPQGSRCAFDASASPAPNYQDMWWRSTESGWGVFLTHQAETIFLAWFTYGADGKATWLVASDVARTGNGTYAGTVFRTTGPPFGAAPWDASKVHSAPAGSVTLTFTADDAATMAWTVDTVSGSKSLTRYAFSSPHSACRG